MPFCASHAKTWPQKLENGVFQLQLVVRNKFFSRRLNNFKLWEKIPVPGQKPPKTSKMNKWSKSEHER